MEEEDVGEDDDKESGDEEDEWLIKEGEFGNADMKKLMGFMLSVRGAMRAGEQTTSKQNDKMKKEMQNFFDDVKG